MELPILKPRQVIETRWTFDKLSIQASCLAGQEVVEFDRSLSFMDGHYLAAQALIQRLGWYGVYGVGGCANGSFVFVQLGENRVFEVKEP